MDTDTHLLLSVEEAADVLSRVWRGINEGDWAAYEAKMEARGVAFALTSTVPDVAPTLA